MNDAQLSRLEAKREKMRHFRELEEAARLSQTAPVLAKKAKAEAKKKQRRKPDREFRTRKPRPRAEVCVGCQVPLRPARRKAEEFPGTRIHEGLGMCARCRAGKEPATIAGSCSICLRAMRPARSAADRFEIETVEHMGRGVCRGCYGRFTRTRPRAYRVHDGSTRCRECSVTLRAKNAPLTDGTRTVGKALPDGAGWLCTTCHARARSVVKGTARQKRPDNCTRCDVPMATRGHKKPEGGRFHGGNGLCTACSSADDKEKKRARAQERIAA